MYGLTPFEKNEFNPFALFNTFEKDFFGDSMPVNMCRTDIRDDGSKYIMEAELPGFDKKDINLDINGTNLVLSAEHKNETEHKDEDGKYIRKERSYGSYRRSFDISGIDADKIDAEYKNCVLTIALPKKAIEEKSVKKLQIK